MKVFSDEEYLNQLGIAVLVGIDRFWKDVKVIGPDRETGSLVVTGNKLLRAMIDSVPGGSPTVEQAIQNAERVAMEWGEKGPPGGN